MELNVQAKINETIKYLDSSMPHEIAGGSINLTPISGIAL